MTFSETPSDILSVPGLEICAMRLTMPLILILDEFLEQPERRQGIVRVRDQRQVAMTQSSVVMVSSGNLKEAVQYKREDYVHPEDLGKLIQALNELEPNNPQSALEVRFRADINQTNYRWFINRYRRVSDALGFLYDVSENIGIESFNQ